MDAAANGYRPALDLDAPHLTDLGNAKRLVRIDLDPSMGVLPATPMKVPRRENAE